MDVNLLLSKCITLLFRESQLENATENSSGLVKTVLEKVKINDKVIGIPTRRDTSLELRKLALEMGNNKLGHEYDLLELLQQIRIITNGDLNLYTAISQALEGELNPPTLKRTITTLRKTLLNHFREQRLAEIVARAHADINFKRHTISDMGEYIRNIILELEVTSSKAVAKDPAITNSLDIGDDTSMREIFRTVASSNSEDLAFTTGWKELNQALQGGPRPGDTVVIGALQHNYKTGFALSLFAHIALYNKPKTKDPKKKPLLYRVTFEDPLRNNAQFLYQLFKYQETGAFVNVKTVTVDEMISYVKQCLQVNGYHIVMDEVNPTNWTYQSLINRVVELESMGYAVEVLEVDYLSKLPTTGCNQGSMGDDVMDMLSRIRAFCAANNILFVTPHQLSTDAKRLLQSLPAEQFLTTIKGGGYFEKTKGLDRIYDIGLLIHKVETENGDYLHVMLDKHRFPTPVEGSARSFFLPFPPSKMPIPSNLHDQNHRVLRKIPRGGVHPSASSNPFDY